MEFYQLVKKITDNKAVVCIVGAGGKTSLMFKLAEQAASMGKKVLVGTTTHILQPAQNYAETIEEAKALWHRGHFAVIGTTAENGKLTMAEEGLYRELSAQADLVLLEADGAKHYPAKIPAEHEPVITADCTLVIAVMGMSAMNKRLKECCFRYQEMIPQITGLADVNMTPHIAAHLLAADRGGRKNTEGLEYLVVLNQCDDSFRVNQALEIADKLEEKGIETVCTCFLS